MKKVVAGCLALSLLATSLGGCATAPQDVPATFHSASVYDDLSCKDLAVQLEDVSSQVNKVTGQQARKRTSDEVVWGVGLVLFWPALFLLATPDHKAELADLKGRYEALQRAGEAKHCGDHPAVAAN